jgi:hypothetical protein
MIVGISRISGTPPSQITQQWQQSVQDQPNLINNPPILNPNPALQGLGQGSNNVGTPSLPTDSFSNGGQNAIAAFQRENQQPTHKFSRWGEEFVGNAQLQDEKDFVNSRGETAAKNTYEGVMAHEEAHYFVAQQYGIQTGPPIVTMGGNGIAEGGHVSLQTEEFDPNRAMTDGMTYVNSFERSMGEGLVASAEAPQNVITRYGTTQGLNDSQYGKLSEADKNIAAKGRENFAIVDRWKTSPHGQLAQVQAEKNGEKGELTPQQKELNAHLASHPDLLQAHLNGTLNSLPPDFRLYGHPI